MQRIQDELEAEVKTLRAEVKELSKQKDDILEERTSLRISHEYALCGSQSRNMSPATTKNWFQTTNAWDHIFALQLLSWDLLSLSIDELVDRRLHYITSRDLPNNFRRSYSRLKAKSEGFQTTKGTSKMVRFISRCDTIQFTMHNFCYRIDNENN